MTAGSPPAPTDVRAWALYIASVADSAVDAKAAVDEAWTQAIAAGVDRLALRATILGERGRADQIDPSPEIRGSRNGRVPGRRRGISRESRQLRDFVARANWCPRTTS